MLRTVFEENNNLIVSQVPVIQRVGSLPTCLNRTTTHFFLTFSFSFFCLGYLIYLEFLLNDFVLFSACIGVVCVFFYIFPNRPKQNNNLNISPSLWMNVSNTHNIPDFLPVNICLQNYLTVHNLFYSLCIILYEHIYLRIRTRT